MDSNPKPLTLPPKRFQPSQEGMNTMTAPAFLRLEQNVAIMHRAAWRCAQLAHDCELQGLAEDMEAIAVELVRVQTDLLKHPGRRKALRTRLQQPYVSQISANLSGSQARLPFKP